MSLQGETSVDLHNENQDDGGIDGDGMFANVGITHPRPKVTTTTGATGNASTVSVHVLPLYQLSVVIHLAITIITIFMVFNSPRVGC
jgi:hypothetical protein